MCTYCMIGDFEFKHNPPFYPPPPFVPMPVVQPWQIVPWPVDRLKEFHDLLERVKKLEDALGCPCEPNKADYIGILKERIEKLEREAQKKTSAANGLLSKEKP